MINWLEELKGKCLVCLEPELFEGNNLCLYCFYEGTYNKILHAWIKPGIAEEISFIQTKLAPKNIIYENAEYRDPIFTEWKGI